jgi:mRNA interferase HicA
VKKRDVIKRLRAIANAANMDLQFVREGSNHEVWAIGSERLVIPRHREINEHTARGIIKRAEEMTADGEE